MNGSHPDIDTNAPPIAVQRSLLENEIAMWTATRYQAQVRLRVQKAIGGDKDIQASIIADLERCERALDCLQGELAALPQSTP